MTATSSIRVKRPPKKNELTTDQHGVDALWFTSHHDGSTSKDTRSPVIGKIRRECSASFWRLNKAAAPKLSSSTYDRKLSRQSLSSRPPTINSRSTLFDLCTNTDPAIQPATTILLVGRTLTRGTPTCRSHRIVDRGSQRQSVSLEGTEGCLLLSSRNRHYWILIYRKFLGFERLAPESARIIIVGCGGRTKHC